MPFDYVIQRKFNSFLLRLQLLAMNPTIDYLSANDMNSI